MKEQISALLDGELDPSETGHFLRRVAADRQMRGTWETYHLIGDVLRGDLGPECASKVASRIADEPTVLAVLAPRRARAPATRLMRLVLPVAASVAAVVFVAWMALPQTGQDLPAVAVAPAAAPVAVGIGDYLLAHQRFSPSGAMQGVATYVRTVAHEGSR